MKTRFFLCAALMLLSLGLSAQTQETGSRPEPPKMKSPAEIAEKKAGMMQREVGLTEKQYKKVYKLFKKDEQYRQNLMEENMGEMPMGRPDGMGGPGMGGGRPPQGGDMSSRPRPEGFPGMGPVEVSEEYIDKQDQKLRKILTDEQYLQWRSKHPVEHKALPPIGQ